MYGFLRSETSKAVDANGAVGRNRIVRLTWHAHNDLVRRKQVADLAKHGDNEGVSSIRHRVGPAVLFGGAVAQYDAPIEKSKELGWDLD